MDTFRYEGRLTGRNIRLIRILPLRVPDPYSRLEIILVSRPLNGADYDALSYVWGDPAVQHEIICNGQSMRIGTSLMEALISRRVISAVSLDAGGSGTKKTAQQGIFREWVWADAICINQSDVIEKTEQVRMMTEIYSNAGQVNIWLGMHKDGDREAIAFLVDLWNLFQDRLKLDFDTLQNGQLREIAPEFDSIIKAPYWKSVYDILSHPCFSRAWVVQELVFARHVLIQRGLISPSVDALFWTVTLLRQYSLDLGYWQHKYDIGPATMMAQIRANFKRTGPNSPLHGWLGACTTMQATDPRDKFFALFGLSKGEDTNFINYSMTFREVACHSGLRALIGHSSGAEGSYGPDQLAWSANPQSRSMGLPSWVPDWFTSSHALRGTHGLPMLFNMTQIRVLGLTPKQEYRGLQSVANSGVKPTKRQIFSRILKTGLALKISRIDTVASLFEWKDYDKLSSPENKPPMNPTGITHEELNQVRWKEQHELQQFQDLRRFANPSLTKDDNITSGNDFPKFLRTMYYGWDPYADQATTTMEASFACWCLLKKKISK